MMNEKLTDWKGNKIKAGQTILKVRTKPLFKNPQFMIPQGHGKFKTIDLPEPSEYIWHRGFEYLIQKFKGELYARLPEQIIRVKSGPFYDFNKNGETWKFAIEIFNSAHNNEIICIKGVSDSEQDYYNDYFKLT